MGNCDQSTEKLLHLLRVKFTRKYIKDSILSHPDHPSLLAISDTLEKYRIETLAVKIDANKRKDMPLPCIVQVESNRQPLFYVLKETPKGHVVYYDDKNKLVQSTKETFLKQWIGVCLLVETTENSKEKDIEKKLIAKRIQYALNEVESDLGFQLNAEDATIVLNDGYAACHCVTNINYLNAAEYDACYGT
ncbi:cysteine peptidase family C39 domain-containing protein [Snuella sedimenti]|uniref:Peptidase C39 domain-containing protein n=1 Tax=Snuella sedimenti TaxID=2798802 RepID=A0A8J7IQ72_9FLAO|nr:cysteine peptidase family C39 domain-containing protein [Snuella sedimenti]MBJ6369057.1 hypothetical protein [Snuella sedimenti]